MPAIGATNAAIAAVSCNEAFKCVRVKCSGFRLLNNTLLLYRPLNNTLQVLLQVRPHNPAANSKAVLLVLARIHYRFPVLFDAVCGRYTRAMGDDSEQPTDPYAPNRFQVTTGARLWSQNFAGHDEGCDTCRSVRMKTPNLKISGSTTLRLALPQLAEALGLKPEGAFIPSLMTSDVEVLAEDFEGLESGIVEEDRQTFRCATSLGVLFAAWCDLVRRANMDKTLAALCFAGLVRVDHSILLKGGIEIRVNLT